MPQADRGDRDVSGEQPPLDPEAQARREFLTKLTKVGATVPAVTLLLAANFKSAAAQIQYGNGGSGCGGGGSGTGITGGCGCGCTNGGGSGSGSGSS